jgi:hypothetical protein
LLHIGLGRQISCGRGHTIILRYLSKILINELLIFGAPEAVAPLVLKQLLAKLVFELRPHALVRQIFSLAKLHELLARGVLMCQSEVRVVILTLAVIEQSSEFGGGLVGWGTSLLTVYETSLSTRID